MLMEVQEDSSKVVEHMEVAEHMEIMAIVDVVVIMVVIAVIMEFMGYGSDRGGHGDCGGCYYRGGHW